MIRNLNALTKAHLENQEVSPVYLFYFDHPEEPIYINSGVSHIKHDGKVWQGLGTMGAMSAVSENERLERKQMTFELALFDEEHFDYVKDNVRGREVEVSLAFLDIETGGVVPDPILLWSGVADTLTPRMERQTLDTGEVIVGSIILTCHSITAKLDKGSRHLYSAESQRLKALKLAGVDDSIMNDIQPVSLKEVSWAFGAP